jgi:hypothetical protein
MSTCHTFQGAEILSEVERALKTIQDDPKKPVTVEIINDAIVITPVAVLHPGEELDRIMVELDAKFGKTFEALSK